MTASTVATDFADLIATACASDGEQRACSVGGALYHYARAQLLATEVLLTVGGAQRHAAIHETRKALRRCRAIVALSANSSSNPAYETLDRRLSRLARSLSALRDAEVVALGAKAEMERSVDAAERRRWSALHDGLTQRRDAIEREALHADPHFSRRRESVRGLLQSLSEIDWPLLGQTPLVQALERSAVRLSRAELKARLNNTVANRHRWRRRARLLRMQWQGLADMVKHASLSDAVRNRIRRALHKVEGTIPAPAALAAEVDRLGAGQDARLLQSAVQREARSHARTRPAGESRAAPAPPGRRSERTPA